MQFQQRGAAIPVRLDAMVASLEDCELEGADVGPAWEMLRSVLIAVAHQFLGAAESGAYETRSVIGIVTLLLQGGLLGLRGNDCLEANGNTEGLGDILDRFDLVLLERLKDADRGVSRLNGSEGDIRQIVAAAYQFQPDNDPVHRGVPVTWRQD